jgi:competence protein ComEC
MEKPKLFENRKEFVWTMLVLLSLFLLRLGWEYRNYTEFISKPFFFTHATVLNAYEKKKGKRTYQVLKLQSDEGLTFYTTIYQKVLLQHKQLRLQIFPSEKISFAEYLGNFYVKSRIKESKELPCTAKETVLEKVAKQHDSPEMASFYNAIFFATPLQKEMREKISLLGVSHLVALSGFHLGILWALVYGILMLLYKPLQQHYFPYRFSLFDLGIVTVAVLGLYVWFVGFPPSLLRSYAMLVTGWIILLMGLELLNFAFLALVVSVLLVLFPSLEVSLGFWFSVSGVFYIFLLLQYAKRANKWLVTLLVIPVGIFVLMLPVVHTVFGMTSPYQLLSPLLSILFIPFYPVSMLLHLLGMGDMFDTALLTLFSLPKTGLEHLLPLWVLALYMILSFAAIYFKTAFYLLLAAASVYAVYVFI